MLYFFLNSDLRCFLGEANTIDLAVSVKSKPFTTSELLSRGQNKVDIG